MPQPEQLAVRRNEPGLVTYEISDAGRSLHAHLTGLEQALRQHGIAIC